MAENTTVTEKKKMSYRAKSIMYKAIAFFMLISPIAIWVTINRQQYFTDVENGVKIGLGCVIALLVALFMILGKMKGLNPIIWLCILELLAYLLSTLISDILWINLCAIIGEAFYMAFNLLYKKYNNLANITNEQFVKEQVKEDFQIAKRSGRR